MSRSSLAARALTWVAFCAAPAALVIAVLVGQAPSTSHGVLAASAGSSDSSASPSSITWP